jgi:lipoate-protein ligase A
VSTPRESGPRLHVFQDPPLDGPTNMARDEHLLDTAHLRPAALRLYGWSPPTLSLGCFQKFADVARQAAAVRELAVVRRQTGGGAILHDREITYALAIDADCSAAGSAPADLYRLVHGVWRDVLMQDGVACELAPDHFPLPTPRSGPFFCFAKPGRTDLLRDGLKVLGSAQRRLPGRILQHGSLFLHRGIEAQPGGDVGDPPAAQAVKWQQSFVQRLAAALGLQAFAGAWDAAALADVAIRRERFADPAWIQRL